MPAIKFFHLRMYTPSTELRTFQSIFCMDILLVSPLSFTMGLALLLFCSFFQPYLKIFAQKSPVRLFHDPDVCKRILACAGVEGLENPNQISAIKARALPNQRLVTVFHINNAFTTMNDDYHRYFRNLTNKKISGLSANVWKRIVKLAHKLVHKETKNKGWKKPKIRLVPFVHPHGRLFSQRF